MGAVPVITPSKGNAMAPPRKAKVTLFRPSGRYYTEEEWEVPSGATGPQDMVRSPDWRRIDSGPVLVDAQEPWGYPHLFPMGVQRTGTRHTLAEDGASTTRAADTPLLNAATATPAELRTELAALVAALPSTVVVMTEDESREAWRTSAQARRHIRELTVHLRGLLDVLEHLERNGSIQLVAVARGTYDTDRAELVSTLAGGFVPDIDTARGTSR